jgi:hypothetical protein
MNEELIDTSKEVPFLGTKHKYKLSKVDSVVLFEATKSLNVELVTSLWKVVSHRMEFDPSTVKMIDARRFLAEPIVKEQVDG